MKKFIFARLREPSTWAGFAAIAAALGHAGGAELIQKIGMYLAPLFGGVAVVLPANQDNQDA